MLAGLGRVFTESYRDRERPFFGRFTYGHLGGGVTFLAGWLLRPKPQAAPPSFQRPEPLTSYPGREIFPVTRWMSLMRLFIQVPRVCWFTPMHQRLTVPRLRSP